LKFEPTIVEKQGGVSQCGLAIYIKSILRQKKNYGNSNISPYKNIIFKKSSKKRNQNPSRYYYNSQVSTQAEISSFKNPHIKIDVLHKGQNPLSYYTL
jgi:hypothetical protein